MPDSFITTPLNQTTPVERLRDFKREAVDRYGKRPRPKKPEGQASARGGKREARSPGSAKKQPKSPGK